MLKKLMKVLLIILASIIILAALLFGFAKTYIYIKDWKYEQKLMQNMKYVERRNNEKAYIEELINENDSIIRVDIYHRSLDDRKKYKNINEYPLIGSITDENQLKNFKNFLKKHYHRAKQNYILI